MTEKTPTRTRRDMVRELGEAVLDAVRGAVCDAIRNDPTFVNREILKQAMGPHMAHAAKSVANSDEFQKAITDRLTLDLFESLKPVAAAPAPPAAPTPAPPPEPAKETLHCPQCDRYGQEAIDRCARVQCPFRAPGSMPGLEAGAELATVAEHRTGSGEAGDDLPWPDMGGSDAAE